MEILIAQDLQSLASTVYGAHWQSALSRDMGIGLRTVQRWAREGISKPATAEGVRRFLEERRIARIAPPPAGSSDEENRDDACADAMGPGVMALLCAARDAGWSAPEALAAMLSVIVDEMIAGAGDAAAASVLRDVLASVEARKGS